VEADLWINRNTEQQSEHLFRHLLTPAGSQLGTYMATTSVVSEQLTTLMGFGSNP